MQQDRQGGLERQSSVSSFQSQNVLDQKENMRERKSDVDDTCFW
jgi:hypothetical protein